MAERADMLNSEPAPVVGYLTSTQQTVCVPCGQSADYDARDDYGTGRIMSVILDPAPYGVYRPHTSSLHYGAPCAVCGWPIRREKRA